MPGIRNCTIVCKTLLRTGMPFSNLLRFVIWTSLVPLPMHGLLLWSRFVCLSFIQPFIKCCHWMEIPLQVLTGQQPDISKFLHFAFYKLIQYCNCLANGKWVNNWRRKQKVYCSAVGTLIKFVKYSQPDIANQVWKLATCMDKANEHAFKEMKRLIQFVLDTNHFGLKLKPKGTFRG